MFGTKKLKVVSVINGVSSIIAEGTKVNGPMTFVGSMKVAGDINGNVDGFLSGKGTGPNSVQVEPSGKIQGALTADNVIIAGTVVGDVFAKSVYLASTANITGSIRYEVLAVEAGAQVNGELQSLSQSQPTQEQPLKEAA